MLKNIGLNLSSLNYYISKSKNRLDVIIEFLDIAKKIIFEVWNFIHPLL